MQRLYPLLLAIGLGVLLASCAKIQELTSDINPRSLRDRYARSLEKAELDETPMGLLWQAAGLNALYDSILIEPPFKEVGYFTAKEVLANGYRINISEGEVLTVELVTQPIQHQLFAELFQYRPEDLDFKLVAFMDTSSHTLTYEPRQSGQYVLRLQPELLVDLKYALTVVLQPAYSFPVQGKGNADVWSFWGDDRDAGARRHEGIDIFAPRGTPVLATIDGQVSRVRDQGLGGKQVWQTDSKRNLSLYYAHLDSQLVTNGQYVRVGDTLGLVGNTGNARGTRTHLHFGIYRWTRGAVNPLPFVYKTNVTPSKIQADTTLLGQLGRINTRTAELRQNAAKKSLVIGQLPQHTPVQIISASDNYYRVQLPQGESGYVYRTNVQLADKPIRTHKVKKSIELKANPARTSPPIGVVDSSSVLIVLAEFDTLSLVQTPAGRTGWVSKQGL